MVQFLLMSTHARLAHMLQVLRPHVVAFSAASSFSTLAQAKPKPGSTLNFAETTPNSIAFLLSHPRGPSTSISCVLQDGSPLTAIAFSSSGDGLIVTNASNHIGVYNVDSMAATDWTRTVGAQLPARLLDMPGSIASIAVHPKVGPLTQK